MKSLRLRLTVWFTAGLMLVLGVFFFCTYLLLKSELGEKTWEEDYPDHPEWTLHGSYTEEEVQDILGELVTTSLWFGIPLALATLGLGYVLARRSLRPITQVNRQLQEIRAPDLSRRIQSGELDAEFRSLVDHINDLLRRLEKSFTDLSEYAAKVSHELRTPLAILRLKLEQAGDRIAPDLAEELHNELYQLNHIVNQSLLIAKAKQGRLAAHVAVFDLNAMVQEAVSDFSLLAEEQGRTLQLSSPEAAPVSADASHIRQIIHNLLTNALKHGEGAIGVTLEPADPCAVLTIRNNIRRTTSEPDTLGLGLRVVHLLASLQAGLSCEHSQIDGVYVVKLSVPMKTSA